jgi:hypothetical protein
MKAKASKQEHISIIVITHDHGGDGTPPATSGAPGL